MTAPDSGRSDHGLPLTTCSYKAYKPVMGVPIRITVGRPRFFPHSYEYVQGLAPHGIFKTPEFDGKPMDVKELAFHRRCDSLRDEILADLTRIADANKGMRLVLLCYENVHAGEVCHRTWAARWFAARLGWDVPEISPTPPPALF